MIVLWALVFVTDVVALVLANQTGLTEVSNAWVQPPFVDADFVTSFHIIGPTDIHQISVFENIIVAFGKLCNTPYTAHIGPQTLSYGGIDASIMEIAGGEHLAVNYTMWAIYWCFFEMKSSPRIAFRYKEAQCIFGFPQPETHSTVATGWLRFVSRSGSTASSSGSSMPDTDVDVTSRIKSRGNTEAFDPASATMNASGAQELSSVGNLSSINNYALQLRGSGPQMDPEALFISILEALIDRASRSHVGSINARNYRSVNGDYNVNYRPSTLQGAPELSYTTVIVCYVKLLALILGGTAALREGDFACLVNQREALVGSFTKRADGNVGIAAQ